MEFNTHIGEKTIEPDRIMMLADSKGRTDAISIIQEVYQRQKNKLDLKSLNGFVNYVTERSKNSNEHHTRVEDLQCISKRKETVTQNTTLFREPLFLPQEIGKATINTPIEEKDKAKSREFMDGKNLRSIQTKKHLEIKHIMIIY